MAGHDTSSLEVLIAVQTLVQGGLLAFPAAAPELAVYETEGDWQEEMRRGLEKHLPSWAPEALAALLFRRGDLLEVEVELDLRARELDRGGNLRGVFPCLVTAEENDRWVTALRLGHSFHASAKEDLPALAAAEIRRVLKARLAAGEDPLRLLPPASTRLELLPIRLGPPPAKSTKKEQRREDLALLAQVGVPFVAKARDLLPRPAEEARLAAILSGNRRSSVLVVGPDGSGKSALIERVLAGRQQVYLTSGYQWVAGQSLLGQLEERVEQVMAAVQRLDAILYFERFDELLTSRGGGDDLISLFRRFVTRDKVRLVGELDAERLDEAQRAYTSFFSAVSVVRLEALDPENTRALLLARLEAMLPEPEEAAQRGALAGAILELAQRYFADKPLPGIAISLFDELAGLEAEARALGRHIGLAELYRLVSARTGIPEFLLREDLALRLEPLRAAFRDQLIGQEAAIEQLVGILCAVKARLQPEGKPLAVLLFVGPTGVGKTEAARCLARLLFGDERRMIRFDMSEYSDRWAAERLIRGNDREEGLLTRRVRREPFAVVLLDEIEKADRAVFDLLLQVAGEGRLSDARGRTVSFHNVILIMTSNLGAAEQRSSKLGFGNPQQSPQAFYRGQIEEFFRPEMVNRLDRVIVFLPLTAEEVGRIARLQLQALGRRRGFEERGITFEVDEAATLLLAAAGHSPAHGARRLRRELQLRIVAPAAELIARHAARARDAVLKVALAAEPPSAVGSIGRKVAGPFSFELLKRGAGSAETRAEAIEPLQQLRRLIRRLLGGETLSGLAHEIALARRRLLEIQLRLQQLATEKKRRGGPPTLNRQGGELVAEAGRLEQRRHRFAGLLDPLRGLRQEVEDAEELALAELLAGSDPRAWASQMDGWIRRLREALGPALLVQDEGPALCLLLAEADDQRGCEFWLRPLLAELQKGGPAIAAWPLTEKSRLGAGDVLGPNGILQWLDTPKRGRQLILELGDPSWAARLAWEAGWHRFEPAGQPADAAHLSILRVLRARSSEEQREWLRKNQLVRQPVSGDSLRRMPFLRRWQIEGEWWWPQPAAARPAGEAELRSGGLDPFPILAGDYWRRHDEILALQLAPYELQGGGERDEALAPRLLGGPG
jgi:ATP-dependent Clp protease ATP-binding subunit ClpC